MQGPGRVLAVAPSSAPGGAERALVNLARGLQAHDWEMLVVCLSDGPLVSWLSEAGVGVVVQPAGRLRQPREMLRAVSRLRGLALMGDHQVVLGSQNKGHLYAGPAALAARRPAVLWQHASPVGSLIERVAARVPAKAVVVGSSAAEAGQRRLNPRTPVTRIAPGVEVERWTARSGDGRRVRASLGWQDSRIVGISGRLSPEKAQDVFLDAAAIVARSRPDVRFLVVGGAVLGWEAAYVAELKDRVRRSGLENSVHFAGHQEDPAPYVDAMDVVVVSSHAEPFGLVVVEAMALGKAVVATRAGGPLDIIQESETGLLVPPGDATALARSVEHLLADSALRERLGSAARGRANDYSLERSAARFASLLRRVRGDG